MVRTTYFKMRVTTNELAILQQMAADRGLNMSQLIRASCAAFATGEINNG